MSAHLPDEFNEFVGNEYRNNGRFNLQRPAPPPRQVLGYFDVLTSVEMGAQREQDLATLIILLTGSGLKVPVIVQPVCNQWLRLYRGSPSNDWCRRWDLNPRPRDYETLALPLSYTGTIQKYHATKRCRSVSRICRSRCRWHGGWIPFAIATEVRDPYELPSRGSNSRPPSIRHPVRSASFPVHYARTSGKLLAFIIASYLG